MKLALTFLLITAGLAGRSALDKLLALRGGPELVALWAQVSSLSEVVVGVVSAGVGAGLVVHVARSSRDQVRRRQLDEAIGIGLRLSLPVALVVGAAGWIFTERIGGPTLPGWIPVLAAAAGWVAVIPMLISNYWQGAQRYGVMTAVTCAFTFIGLIVAWLLPADALLPALVAMLPLPIVILPFLRKAGPGAPPSARRIHLLRRYILPGLSIGILSPLSLIVVRSTVGEALSWHEAGVLQGLFRVSEWVGAIAGGHLSIYYLPRFSAARGAVELRNQMALAAKEVLIPSALVLGILLAVHRPLLAWLYDPTLQASDAAAALYLAGSLVRIAAWIPLFALFAQRRTRAVAIGELFSLPLFALLVYLCKGSLTLEWVGAFWLLAYCAYAIFNIWSWSRAPSARTRSAGTAERGSARPSMTR